MSSTAGKPRTTAEMNVATRRRARARKIAYRVLIAVASVAIALFSIFPFYWMILTSIKPEPEIFTLTPQFWTFNPTFHRYQELLAGPIGRQLLNSTIIAAGATFISILCGTMAAYALSRYRVPAKKVIATGLLVVQMLPAIVIVVPLFQVFRTAGLLNSYLGVIIAHTALSLALSVWLVRGFLAGIPMALDEAALVDGATRRQVLIHVIVPLALPGIAVSAVFAFITSWNELLLAMTFLQRESMKTLPGALQGFQRETGTDWGGTMTASTIFAIPVMIFFVVIRKHLASGAAVGAVKG